MFNKRIGILVVAFVSFGLAACSGGNNASAPVKPGDITADNLIIYDNGVLNTSGNMVLSASGNFVPAGPTVVYIVRTISELDQAALKRDRIKLKPHTAYLVPAETALTIDVLRKLKPIGAVDEALSLNEVRALFGDTPPETVDNSEADDLDQGTQARIAELRSEQERLEQLLMASYAQLAQMQADGAENIEELELSVQEMEARYESLVQEEKALQP